MRFHFWQRVKIKNFLYSGPLSGSRLVAQSTLGTRAQHMSDLPLKRGYESLCLVPLWGVLNRAAPPTCKAAFGVLGGRLWISFFFFFLAGKYEP